MYLVDSAILKISEKKQQMLKLIQTELFTTYFRWTKVLIKLAVIQVEVIGIYKY